MERPILYIEPERLARWKRTYPIHWREVIRLLEMDAIIKRGDATPEFIREGVERVSRLLVSMFDLACPTEERRQKMRRSFRQLLAEFPISEEINPSIRQRLNEHEMFVRHGLEPLDPDEIEGGC
jgi:hypothetical protein